VRIAFVAIVLLAFPALAQTVTLQNTTGGYSGTDDARIVCCDSASFNEGGNEVIDLIPADVTAYLIRFAILQSEGGSVPTGVTVQSATLSIYKNYGPGAVFALDRLTQPWSEGGVTWDSTGTAPWSSPGGDIDPSGEVRGNANDSIALNCPVTPPVPDACWFNLDVTGLVQGIVSGTPNNGWKLSYVSDLDGSPTLSHEPKEFFSSETSRDDSLRPKLTVTYVQQAPPQPTNSAIMQQGNGYSSMSDARITCCDTANVNEGANTYYALIGENSTSALVRYRIFQSEGGPVPDNVTISSAELKFYKYWGPATTFALKRVLRNWDQAAVTWNTTGVNGIAWDAPGAFGPGDVGVTDSTATHGDSQALSCPADEPGPDACWVKFDVTGAVQGFADGLSNFGWKLVYQGDAAGGTTNMNQPKEMYSSEDSRAPSLRPVLTVSWATGSRPPKRTLLSLHRLYRASNTDWLYTTDEAEVQTAKSLGYADYRIAGSCMPANGTEGVPLYRFWKGAPQNEHFYTTLESDKATVLAPPLDYQDESVACRVWSTPVDGSTRFYRMTKFNPANGDLVHFYTTSTSEVADKQRDGFTLEEEVMYIMPPPASQPDASWCALPDGGYEGFGRNTTGGTGQTVYHVTRNDDFYPDTAPLGTLRDALSQGNRCIVFDQGGIITLKERLYAEGPNITIDGFSAPSEGVTLQGESVTTPSAIVLHGAHTSGNIVIRGIRHRGPKPEDGITIIGRERDDTVHPAVHDVVIDHVSVNGQVDGAIDVTEQANHVTIQWSILGTGTVVDRDAGHELTLLNYGTWAISVHHNLFIDSTSRMPACYDHDLNGPAPRAPGIVCDVRNNLIWNTHQAGTEVRLEATGNVINNFYRPAPDINYNREQLVAWVRNPPPGGEPNPPASGITSTYYVSGNVVSDPVGRAWDLVPSGNQPAPLSVPDFFIPATSSAEAAAQAVKDQAGARCSKWGLDGTDAAFIGEIQF
jgi:hypothetical protein